MKHATWLLVLAPLGLQTQEREDPAQADLERARAHYAAVEHELGARDVSSLTAEQRAARALMIATLDAYRERGEFTRNTDFPGARVPYFVDHEGRLCAVANLLHVTGEDELVHTVVEANNHVWVSELAGDARFTRWLERVGLSFDEAVRIQGPGHGPPPPPPLPPPTKDPSDGTAGPARPGSSGPLPSAAAPQGPGPLTLAGSSGPGSGPLSSMPSITPADTAGLEDWMQWWEFNKLRWLEPELRARSMRSPADDSTGNESGSAGLRRRYAPRILAELANPQAAVRASAAFAYARVAGAAAVPELRKLFADQNRDVRESAILALGVSGSEEGVHALLTLLREERVPTPRAKPLAIVALGVARMHGLGRGTDAILAQFLPALEREGGDDVLHATLLFQSLSPSNELDQRVRCASGRFQEDCEHAEPRAPTRERALEALRFDTEPSAVLPRLLDAVHGRRIDERRAAACALAEFQGALEPLLTAFELEEEPLTRGRLLLSIGESGGEHARNFLTQELEHGRRSERPWIALSLGLLAGQDWDEGARSLLRAAYARAGKSERDAFLLASGLARDEGAHDILVDALKTSRADKTRMFAAVGLGLIRSQEGHDVLVSTIGSVSCPFARAGMALALAMFGDPADVPTLMRLLRDERRPESLHDLALALGLQGSPETATSLLALLDQDPPATVRSAALDALGLALVDDPALALSVISRSSNYAAWPDWVLGLSQHPL